MSEAIVVHNLSKHYRRFHSNRPWTLQEAFIGGFRSLRPTECLWALRDVSFTAGMGQMIGVIGRNGAGKSTLLRLIGGVSRPDQGTITVKGPIGALLDLGAGFHPDLTGRENVFINGIISGLTRTEVARCLDAIIDFAEIEHFIDSPLRTYSSGMQMRLAFAVAVHVNPEILLIDEVLAVGDLAFQQKCLNRVVEFRNRGCAIILVSHDAGLVGELCDRAIWLDNGEIVVNGSAGEVAGQYTEAMKVADYPRQPARV